jgi:hypothetical protein
MQLVDVFAGIVAGMLASEIAVETGLSELHILRTKERVSRWNHRLPMGVSSGASVLSEADARRWIRLGRELREAASRTAR